jgi:mannose-6-phosphate isomerase-like protein (cupin superfamily)
MRVVRNRVIDGSGTEGMFAGGLATPSRGATDVSVIKQGASPGAANPLHSHDREEVMVQLVGASTVTLGGDPDLRETVELAVGDTLIVPAGIPHQIQNTGQERAEWMLIGPAGLRYHGADGQDVGQPSWAL